MNTLARAKRMLWLFGIFKIPLIGYVRPKIIELTPKRMVVKVPLRRRTRNHLGSMYFGALGIGADLAGAFQAFEAADRKKAKVSIAFKNFSAEFLKRPESDVFFISDAGDQIERMMEETIESKERITEKIHITGYTGYPNNLEAVAEFDLGLSVKCKG